MRPIFLDELAHSRAEDLRRVASLDHRAGRAGRPEARPQGLREALGLHLVRAGFRLLRGTA